MTRDGDAQARIVVLLPTNLPAAPVLPIDLFGALPDFVHGRLIERAGGAGELMEDARTPTAGVSLASRDPTIGFSPRRRPTSRRARRRAGRASGGDQRQPRRSP